MTDECLFLILANLVLAYILGVDVRVIIDTTTYNTRPPEGRFFGFRTSFWTLNGHSLAFLFINDVIDDVIFSMMSSLTSFNKKSGGVDWNDGIVTSV